MESPKTAVDLEKELTCSICTELLYQPLTLLDCLHTFCGACLKEWFSFQAYAAETNPTPPAPGKAVFTCPSCRDAVRSTRHNATVATLLDMLLAAQPDKRKSAGEQAEMDSKYRPGDNVMPKLRLAERTPEQLRLDEEERRLVDEVRELSRHEAVAGSRSSSLQATTHRRTHQNGSSRDASRDAGRDAGRVASRDTSRQRSSTGRRPGDSADARAAGAIGRGMGHQSSLRSLISRSGQGSSGLLDIEREIEEFARQIQEEGILDGLDLDNIDLNNDDELSRRIAEAYQRRQRGRSRQEGGRRSNASGVSSRHSDVSSSSRPPPSSSSRQRSQSRSSQQSGPSRSASAVVGGSSSPAPPFPSVSSSSLPAPPSTERSRPPTTGHAAVAHLEVCDEPRHHRRRRTVSEGRSTSLPTTHAADAVARPGARSQIDLSLRQEKEGEPQLAELEASSLVASPPPLSLPFRDRASGLGLPRLPSAGVPAVPDRKGTVDDDREPTTATTVHELPLTTATFASSPVTLSDGFDRNPLSPLSPLTPSSPAASSPSSQPQQHRRTRSLLYAEPAITCSGCGREHIEYDVHYNCAVCSNGHWNICLDCYRRGRGCQHWFGFGYAAWHRWKQAAAGAEAAGATEPLAPPHMLTANRYMRPRTMPGGADGRRTLTGDDPQDRLQSGVFCARCQAWANSCYWRCDVCNEGDWGFCNDCVDQGRSCTHPLLPLAHQSSTVFSGIDSGSCAAASASATPLLPAPPIPPRAARPLQTSVSSKDDGGAGANDKTAHIGSFRPLTFATACDMCRRAIAPTRPRFHCYTCHSSALAVEPETEEAQRPGDYDLCEDCYAAGALVGGSNISAENGPAGWRRCPAGHRMVVVVFREDGGSKMQRRIILQDLVGGRRLQAEQQLGDDLQTWYIWFGQQRRYERFVTADVRAEAPPPPLPPPSQLPAGETRFPPAGGIGRSAIARWAWYPEAGADDELAFPKNAEVREIEDVNGEWFYGMYMGNQGLFPGGYVRMTGEQ